MSSLSHLNVLGNAQQRSDDERGAVMLEFAIVAFGLFIGTLIFVDTARLIHEYLVLSQVTAEGVKLLSRTPALDEGEFDDQDQDAAIVAACGSPLSAAANPCGHLDAHEDIRFLLEEVPTQIETAASSIRSGYENAPVTGPGQTVYMRITTVVDGFFLPNMPLSVSHEGPYLIRGT